MNKLFIVPFCLISGSVIAQPNPDPARGLWYGKWVLALVPVALGLVFHLLTLGVAVFLIRECVRQGRFKRMSGLPFVGPFFICLGLWWSPSGIPVWVYVFPWGLEFLAGIACVLVQKATHAKPE
ncbi:membrane hypothetical protein [Candidatus Accumulibacter aalborgensis]|uniref:Transmembrane protein n=1 Tax=Candidatus Accumulibacter aalborgensis TaxID=1860102 RepID=A0A1A8XRZ5_9PROT|nr:hypothetical protein [Candidatus Accumulibacter aalborgensis]SBT07889.1 membrane hypothetical protein [Candidatus Accumulibacter aalborgensis]